VASSCGIGLALGSILPSCFWMKAKQFGLTKGRRLRYIEDNETTGIFINATTALPSSCR
jgi:hypothetical protein